MNTYNSEFYCIKNNEFPSCLIKKENCTTDLIIKKPEKAFEIK